MDNYFILKIKGWTMGFFKGTTEELSERLESLGYTHKNDGISVGGCGMDMISHTLYSVAGTLKANGYKVPKDYMNLADHYHYV